MRDNLGLGGLKITCLVLNCNVGGSLGDPAGQLFLITLNTSVNLNSFLTGLLNQVGIIDAEVDQQLFLVEGTAGPVPESLIDSTPLTYYGAPVWNGYVNQPAAVIVRVLPAQSTFNVTGAGSLVAMIDTGVDTQHPALVPVLVPGYNFINNTPSGSEMGDVNESTAAVLDGGGSPAPALVNSSTIAVVNESSAAVLDGGPYGDFGHGTMTAGIVHLVAPQAKIMPLKAFAADGSGYVSNIIRATYYAVQNGANVLSMSFSFASLHRRDGDGDQLCQQSRRDLRRFGGEQWCRCAGISSRSAECYGSCFRFRLWHSVQLLELWIGRLGGCSWRGHYLNLSLRHLFGGLGNFFQRTICFRHGGTAGERFGKCKSAECGGGNRKCTASLRQWHGERGTRCIPVRAGLGYDSESAVKC